MKKEGYITFTELAKRYNVSESTIRRDAKFLEEEKVLMRSHGGVISAGQLQSISMESRTEKHKAEKRAIGERAAELIQAGDSVFFDAGITVLEVVKSLKKDLEITAVTNSLLVALELIQRSGIHSILLGGSLRNETFSVVGPLSERNVCDMYFTKAFIGTGGITPDGFITYYNLNSIELKKKVIERSEKVILVADSSKFNKRGFSAAATVDQLNLIVTDSISKPFQTELEGKNVEIILAEL